MARYVAQFRNNVLRKLLSLLTETVGEVAVEFRITTATISNGALQVAERGQV
jgi:hypothetical protein